MLLGVDFVHSPPTATSFWMNGVSFSFHRKIPSTISFLFAVEEIEICENEMNEIDVWIDEMFDELGIDEEKIYGMFV